METRSERAGNAKSATSPGDPPTVIRVDEFVVYRRGDPGAFAKLARNWKSPPPMKKGAYDFMAELRAARDGDSGF